MSRRLLAVTAIVLALAGGIGAAQTQRQSNRTSWWQAERTFQLNQIMARARVSYTDALLKVQIGTLAPIDVKATQETLARMDEMIKADAARTTAPAGYFATRTKLAELLNQLELTEVRFDNGMVSTKEMNDAYMEIVRLLVG